MSPMSGFLQKLMSQLSPSSGGPSEDPNFSENIRSIESVLAGADSKEANFLAVFALLLGRIAYADEQVTKGEKNRIQNILREQMHLSSEKAALVTQLALEKMISNQLESHLILRKMNEITTLEQKRDVVRSLFHLASDEDISEQESEEIRLVSKALGFSHNQFIQLRSEFREYLSILKHRASQKSPSK